MGQSGDEEAWGEAVVKKVLIVDDNSANRYLLKSLLEEAFEVTEAENGKEALDKAYAAPPDLIVSDILMPVMDGYALCRQWKSDDQLKHIPLVFYTATYTEHRDEVFALKLGADRFVLKPQDPIPPDEDFERGAGRRPCGQTSDK